MTQAWIAPEISTTVRTVITQAPRTEWRPGSVFSARLLKLAASWFPELSARLLGRMFMTPRSRHKALDLGTARRVCVRVGTCDVQVGLWGNGPLVLLAHGWGGSGEQLTMLREQVIANGFTAVSFDAPGHGLTPGSTSSLPLFGATIARIAERLGPLHAIIGHSLGATAAALYARSMNERAPGLVLFAPMPGFQFAIEQFSQLLALDSATQERVMCSIEQHVATGRNAMELLPIAPTSRTLLIHDTTDRSIPVAYSRELAQSWAGSRLIETNGLGHSRVLQDVGVVAQVVSFVEQLPLVLDSALDRQLRALDEAWPD